MVNSTVVTMPGWFLREGLCRTSSEYHIMVCSSVIAFLLRYLYGIRPGSALFIFTQESGQDQLCSFSLRNQARISFVHFHSGIRPGSALFIFTQESGQDQLCSFSLRNQARISFVHFHSGIRPGTAFSHHASTEELSSTYILHFFCTQATCPTPTSSIMPGLPTLSYGEAYEETQYSKMVNVGTVCRHLHVNTISLKTVDPLKWGM